MEEPGTDSFLYDDDYQTRGLLLVLLKVLEASTELSDLVIWDRI